MRLKDLLEGLDYKTGMNLQAEIRDVSDDSRRLEAGALFVCVRGETHDGANDAADMLARGAAAVVCESDLGLKEQILVADARHAYAVLCENFFGRPAAKLVLAAVTGTNGKTTTAAMLRSILAHAGHKCGLIGTVEIDTGARRTNAEYTTPDSYTLSRMLAEMVLAGCTHCVVEASSQALAQHRLDGCRFAAAVFTNLTQDHLDYHKDMESYYMAKRALFELADAAVVNYDDASGQRLLSELKLPKLSFSTRSDKADLTARNIEYSADGARFLAVGTGMIERVSIPYLGEMSVANTLAAAQAARFLGVPDGALSAALAAMPQVPGRLERLTTGLPFTVIRDYAHTPDALQKLLEALRPVTANRLLLLFGCGGDRDRGKRSLMGEAACAADYVLLTSDNPRSEDPQEIIAQIRPGLDKYHTPYKIIQDRVEAIGFALDMLEPGDVLILAGKGHETWQLSGGEKLPLDEAEIVRQHLNRQKEE